MVAADEKVVAPGIQQCYTETAGASCSPVAYIPPGSARCPYAEAAMQVVL